MKKTAFYVVILTVLVVPVIAGAQFDIDLGGLDDADSVNIDPDGSVDFDVNSTEGSIDGSGGTVDIDSDSSVNIDSEGEGTVEFETDGAAGTIDGNTESIDVTGSDDTSVHLDATGGTIDTAGGLEVQINNLDAGERQAVISLDGGTVELINDTADLEAYVNVVRQERPAVSGVSINADGVSVTYRQPSRFLGIFPASLNARAEVASDGRVRVRYPWYHFLFSKDASASDVESRVQVRISSEGVDVSTLSADADEEVRVQNTARVVNAVSATVESSSGSATSDGNDTSVESQHGSGINTSGDDVEFQGRSGNTLEVTQ